MGEPDASGRRRPQNIENSSYNLDMDIVIESIGQKSSQILEQILPGVEIKNGLVQTKAGTTQTSRAKVFSGGDIVRGVLTVVQGCCRRNESS